MCQENALRKDYFIEEEIGRGRFGVVWRCRGSSGEPRALKAIDKTGLTDPLDARCLLTEPKILAHLAVHPNVTRLYDVYEEDSCLHIITELCAGGDLHSLVSSVGPLPETQARTIFTQIMKAIYHCHSCGVVHRDIKPENVLFDSRGNAKLADFGSADFLDCDGIGLTGVVGTPCYVAPEILQGRVYGEKVDIWSAGVLLYVMLAGVPPFYGDDAVETFEAVLRGNLRFPSRTFHAVSLSVKDLLKRMLCKDVSRRLSADKVLGHPWMFIPC